MSEYDWDARATAEFALLHARTRKCLIGAGLCTRAEVAAVYANSPESLLKLENFGRKSLADVRLWLAQSDEARQLSIIDTQSVRLKRQSREIETLKARLALVTTLENWLKSCPLADMLNAGMLEDMIATMGYFKKAPRPKAAGGAKSTGAIRQ